MHMLRTRTTVLLDNQLLDKLPQLLNSRLIALVSGFERMNPSLQFPDKGLQSAVTFWEGGLGSWR